MNQTTTIGVTERGDAGIDFSWVKQAKDHAGLILVTKDLTGGFIKAASKVNCIVHATITGLGGSIYEPNVTPYEFARAKFQMLIDELGTDRVVLRIDPIIPREPELSKAIRVYNDLSALGTRVRISFVDNYPHVKARFKSAGVEPLSYNFHAPLSERKRIAAMFPGAEVCGEPGFDCVGCVSERDLKALNISTSANLARGNQRQSCTCLAVKRELLQHRGQCPNGCLYLLCGMLFVYG